VLEDINPSASLVQLSIMAPFPSAPLLAGSLQEAQINALLTLLNLNLPGSTAPGVAPDALDTAQQGPLVWKVLILDEQSKDILATCLRVQDLREQGVTLHM
jgi:hypothetical protein